jgi:hypothetical protein
MRWFYIKNIKAIKNWWRTTIYIEDEDTRYDIITTDTFLEMFKRLEIAKNTINRNYINEKVFFNR